MITVVYLENALTPQTRKLVEMESTTINKIAPNDWTLPYVAFVNGKAVLRKDWDQTVDEGTVAFIEVGAIPQGGGGGGTNPLRMVLMIAVMVYAPEIAGTLYESMGGTFVAANAGTVLAATQIGVSLVGMALINAVLPVAQPSQQAQQNMQSPSPTYNLQAQGNMARLEAAIPEHFGRLKCFPDIAANPYAEYAGNEQYLYQLLCIGRGQYNLEELKLEDTLITNFDEAQTEVIQPHGHSSLFPTNVTTVSEVTGVELDCIQVDYSQTGTVISVVVPEITTNYPINKIIYLEFTSGGQTYSKEYTISTQPVYTSNSTTIFTVNATNSLTTSGTVKVSEVIGPYNINAVGTSINKIGVDFAAPQGLFYANDDGSFSSKTVLIEITVDKINDLNQVISTTVLTSGNTYSTWSDWVVVSLYYGNEGVNTDTVEWQSDVSSVYDSETGTYFNATTWKKRTRIKYVNAAGNTANTNTAQRWTISYDVPAGRYRVKARRVDIKDTNSRAGHTLAWVGARGYHPDSDTKDYGDCTLLAIKIRATNNISAQASRKVNVIATRLLPIWNGSTWSNNTTTRSPAWALAYTCKQVGLTDSQIDLAALLTLNNTTATRGDYFDGRFDNFISFWESVTRICAAVRTKPYIQGGIFRIMRDQAVTIPVAMFSSRNIVKNSLSIDYLIPNPDTAEIVDVKYFDNTTWQPATVSAWVNKTPDGTTISKPTSISAKIELFGITGRDQAYREGLYQAATNKYRRKLIKFQTEMEGFIPSFGDLITIQHDMPGWGQQGEITGYGLGNNLLTYSEQFDNAAWSKQFSTVTPNTVIAPDGNLTADTVNFTGGTPYDAIYEFLNSSGTFTLSVWVRVSSGTQRFVMTTYSAIEGQVNSAWFTATTSWQRFQWTNTVGVASTWYPVLGGEAVAKSFFVWGAQLETGSSAGPYIPTTTAARTNVPVVTVNETLTWTAGQTHYVGLRKRDGSTDGPFVATQSIYPNVFLLNTQPSSAPYIGMDAEATHIAFGPGETWRQPARVLSVKPDNGFTVTIECINEDSNVHTIDQSVITPTIQTSQLAQYTNAPKLLNFSIIGTYNQRRLLRISWPPAAWAQGYIVESSQDNNTWLKVTDTDGTSTTMLANSNSLVYVRVAAYNVAKGPWIVNSYTVPPVDNVANLTVVPESPGYRITWDAYSDVDWQATEIRLGTSWDSGVLLASKKATSHLLSRQPVGDIKVWAKHYDIYGDSSPTATTNTYSVTAPTNYDVFTITFDNDNKRLFNFKYTVSTPPIELAGAVIRFSHGAFTGTYPNWDTMTPWHDGILTSSFESTLGVPGNYIFAIKAVTLSGSYSANPKYLPINLPVITIPVDNITPDPTWVNTNITVNSDGSLSGAGSGAPVLSNIAGSIGHAQFNDDYLILNIDGTDVDVELRFDRGTGGPASVTWNGNLMQCSRPFISQQLGINNISATEPTTPFAKQIWIDPLGDTASSIIDGGTF